MSQREAKSTSVEEAVLAANASFYRAFSEGAADAMNEVWATRQPVSCLHPGAPLLQGREAVLDSFKRILAGSRFTLRSDGAVARVYENMAIVCCYEANENQPAHLAATNIFVLEGGAWRMVHHQAGPLSERVMPAPPKKSSSGKSWVN